MGLFDFFKKKQKKVIEKPEKQQAQEDVQVEKEVEEVIEPEVEEEIPEQEAQVEEKEKKIEEGVEEQITEKEKEAEAAIEKKKKTEEDPKKEYPGKPQPEKEEKEKEKPKIKEEETKQAVPKEAAALDEGLKKTKDGFFAKISKAVLGRSKVDETVLDDLEAALIEADVGIDTTVKIIDKLEERVTKDKFLNTSQLNQLLKEEIATLLSDDASSAIKNFEIPEMNTPYVIMVVGVNGVGKTSTIGKLAYKLKQKGKQVMLGAADTFRAAAIEQLSIWAERVDIPCVAQEMGSDPASVAYDTLSSAAVKKSDVVIIDTAGRLHNKKHLMDELGKIKRVMQKVIPEAPHEILLVLDATTGQNAIEQAKQFLEVTDVNAIALTKLDGTAKGGVVLGISDQFNMPIKYIGIGEKLDDLQIFNKQEFIDSLFK